ESAPAIRPVGLDSWQSCFSKAVNKIWKCAVKRDDEDKDLMIMSAISPQQRFSRKESIRKFAGASKRSERCAVILAGGDGTRLQSLTRTITGDDRPKQFVPFIGGSTLLDQTRRRVALSVLPRRTLFVVTEKHQRFYRSLAD